MTSTPPRVVGLRVEHHEGDDVLGVATSTPRLSWRTETDTPAWRQAAWEVDAVDSLGKPLWQSGRQNGRDSVLVSWGGDPLASRAHCTWRVRVWGADGSQSDWSEPASFELGLLDAGDWSAVAVGAAWHEDLDASQPCPHLRHTFTIDGDVRRARLYATALGLYELTINGARVGDHVLAPGWTAYRSRVHVQTYDVTSLLQPGENTVTAVLADGWYRGNLGFAGNRNVYGDRLALIAQLEVEADGDRRLTITTDASWEAAVGPVRAADLYDGETVDALVELGPWSPVEVVEVDMARLQPQPTPPVRVTEVVRPVEIFTSPSGRTIVDFGQNLVGVIRFRVDAPAGTTITLRHAEVLENGELCTRILRSARATDSYTCAGTGVEEWHPRFTFHGFRYAEVDGWPSELTIDDLEALVLHTDMRRTGWFECSNELVNQLHENIVWGWRGNSVSVPTDCPQRDERLGWTGDLQVFTPTASFIYDTAAFLDGWLRDLVADQLPDGRVPAIIPDAMPDLQAYAAGWGDAATVVPWEQYRRYGDADLLERQLGSMRAWVDSIAERAGPSRLWNNEFQFGDWVDPTVDPHTPGSARTDPGFVATAYFARSADLVAAAARVVGRDDIADQYEALAAEVRAAIAHEWVAPSGRVVADTQAGCALALVFDLVPEHQRAVVGERLRRLVRAENHRLSTGFLGTPVLTEALTRAGHVDDAYRMLLQTAPPSWLYPVTMGATTIWERWEAMLPDGSLSAGAEMLSFNHYALGAVGAWLHERVAGFQLIEAGYRRFAVAPVIGRGISSASARFDSPHGRIEASWSLAGRGVDLRVTAPPNTDALDTLPGTDREPIEAGSGTHQFRYAVSEEQYRRWVPPRYSVTSPAGELHDDPAAWAIVERLAPTVAESYADERSRDLPLWRLGTGGTVGLAQLRRSPLAAELAALDPVPAPPEEIMP